MEQPFARRVYKNGLPSLERKKGTNTNSHIVDNVFVTDQILQHLQNALTAWIQLSFSVEWIGAVTSWKGLHRPTVPMQCILHRKRFTLLVLVQLEGAVSTTANVWNPQMLNERNQPGQNTGLHLRWKQSPENKTKWLVGVWNGQGLCSTRAQWAEYVPAPGFQWPADQCALTATQWKAAAPGEQNRAGPECTGVNLCESGERLLAPAENSWMSGTWVKASDTYPHLRKCFETYQHSHSIILNQVLEHEESQEQWQWMFPPLSLPMAHIGSLISHCIFSFSSWNAGKVDLCIHTQKMQH